MIRFDSRSGEWKIHSIKLAAKTPWNEFDSTFSERTQKLFQMLSFSSLMLPSLAIQALINFYVWCTMKSFLADNFLLQDVTTGFFVMHCGTVKEILSLEKRRSITFMFPTLSFHFFNQPDGSFAPLDFCFVPVKKESIYLPQKKRKPKQKRHIKRKYRVHKQQHLYVIASETNFSMLEPVPERAFEAT